MSLFLLFGILPIDHVNTPTSQNVAIPAIARSLGNAGVFEDKISLKLEAALSPPNPGTKEQKAKNIHTPLIGLSLNAFQSRRTFSFGVPPR